MSETHVSAELRTLIRERACFCCEYCRLPESVAYYSYEVDHIIAEKHGGLTTDDNLAWTCFSCNRHKGSDLSSVDPLSGNIVPLFNPRRHAWTQHFRIVDVRIQGLTPEGRATARLLHFNSPEQLREREPLIRAGIFKPPSSG